MCTKDFYSKNNNWEMSKDYAHPHYIDNICAAQKSFDFLSCVHVITQSIEAATTYDQ